MRKKEDEQMRNWARVQQIKLSFINYCNIYVGRFKRMATAGASTLELSPLISSLAVEER